MGFYVGIDLNEKYAMVSCCDSSRKEPVTLSTVAGSENYQIPVCVARKKGNGHWYYGDEAKKYGKDADCICVDNLLKRALKAQIIHIEEQSYEAGDLLAVFLKKVLALPGKLKNSSKIPDRLVITLDRITKEKMELFSLLMEKLSIPAEHLMLLDYRESFYYYAFCQEKELCLHDVALYEFSGSAMKFFCLSYNSKTLPHVVTMEEKVYEMPDAKRDEGFYSVIEDSLKGRIVSSVHLVGDGFDGEWMNRSLRLLCVGKRVFAGKNLYSKGACYAAVVKCGKREWAYVYLGDDEMKVNVSLKVINDGKEEFYSLITAGENWYEAAGECEVILIGSPSVDVWLQLPLSREASVRTLELSDLPRRPAKTTRLRVTAKPLSADKVWIQIKDLGFGELYESQDQSFEFTMTL